MQHQRKNTLSNSNGIFCREKIRDIRRAKSAKWKLQRQMHLVNMDKKLEVNSMLAIFITFLQYSLHSSDESLAFISFPIDQLFKKQCI